MKICFITGARSEYGVMKPLIQELVNDSRFDVSIVATGMHFLHKFGYTIDEIKKDSLAPIIQAPCYTENEQSKKDDFVNLINAIYPVFNNYTPDIVYIIGDRLEAYAASLVAHFKHIPIAHYAGGQITKGAVDNIYRYNISNLASIHFVTNKYAVDRLKKCPVVDSQKVHLVGSTAIDAIYKYLKYPQEASVIDNRLRRDNYVLMTFHSETNRQYQGCSIAEMMETAIKYIIDKRVYILITYPNNDYGSENVIDVIHKWEKNQFVVVCRNLGADNYYIAVDNSKFVIGNSSSAIIEVPYFKKYSLDIGERQKGRNAPKSVIHIPNNKNLLITQLEKIWFSFKEPSGNECIYGDGNSVNTIKEILLNEIS
ncbi:MAG: UDP-N-acetylglucosamine 2-epimerase (hydrolyzing) [Paludibacteraceae bacterium]|nr:UDP-N-acetylglucosamine 2-epimerase (hydrolyzing) [Paludibacteraceae bacterium]